MVKQYKRSLWNKSESYLTSLLLGVVIFSFNSCGNRTPVFEVKEEALGNYKEIFLKNNQTGEYVSVIPDFGATINQIALSKNGKVYELVDGCKTSEELLGDGKNTFKGSKLFPFPNRIRDGKYQFEGKEYQLPVNFPQENNAIHGLVLTENFKLLTQESGPERASVSLQYEFTGDKQGYPFKAVLLLELELNKNGFICKTTVTNTDSSSIPVGEGWHPYFKTGTKVDELILKLPTDSLYLVDDRMIPTLQMAGVNGYNQPKKIGSDKFDTGYKVNYSGTTAQTEIIDPVQNFKLVVWQETGMNKYNFLQVYTPPHRNTIAIEPMTCLADAFNNEQGLIILNPTETLSFSFGVKLE